jgi:hypothetical protein
MLPIPVPITNGTETRKKEGVSGELNKTRAPTIKEVNPATVSAPCVGALTSSINKTKDVAIKANPNQLTGKIPRPYVPSARHTTPMKPAIQPPGLEISMSNA